MPTVRERKSCREAGSAGMPAGKGNKVCTTTGQQGVQLTGQQESAVQQRQEINVEAPHTR